MHGGQSALPRGAVAKQNQTKTALLLLIFSEKNLDKPKNETYKAS